MMKNMAQNKETISVPVTTPGVQVADFSEYTVKMMKADFNKGKTWAKYLDVTGFTHEVNLSFYFVVFQYPVEVTSHKGYRIETRNGSSMIYQGHDLRGCTHTDYGPNGPLENSAAKAMKRIDAGKLTTI